MSILVGILGGRKFVAFMILTILATIFILTKVFTADNFISFEEFVAALFIGSNVADGAVEKFGGFFQKKQETKITQQETKQETKVTQVVEDDYNGPKQTTTTTIVQPTANAAKG